MNNIMISVSVPTADGISVELPATTNSDGMVNLTDLWKTFGSIENKDPRKWALTQGSKDFIEALTTQLNVSKKDIYKGQRGKGGATYAHWQVAMSYLTYLSPRAQMVVNEIVRERMEEEANPELAYARGRQRAIAGYRRQGKEDLWIHGRLKGIAARNEYTDELARKGVTGFWYGHCTNAIYEPLLGGKASKVKQDMGLKDGQNIRDHLDVHRLADVDFAESLAARKLAKTLIRGGPKAEEVSRRAATLVKKTIDITLEG